MNFQELLAKMQQLDQPVGEECGMMPPSAPMGTTAANEAPVAPPSMSINLNAQGMDNIEDLMKLVTKVNPDMEKPDLPPLPSMGADPSIMSIKPSMPPLKMLPDLSDEEGEEGDEAGPDMMNKGEEDEEDEEGEKDDEKEAFANSPAGSPDEPEVKDMDAAIPDGNDLNKPKKSFSDKPYRGDNPMATEGTDLRAQIRAELQKRLAEAKGVK